MRRNCGEVALESTARALLPTLARALQVSSGVPSRLDIDRTRSCLTDTLKEQRGKPHRINSPGRDLDLRGIGSMRVRADEQPVLPRRKRLEHESSDAVRCRRRVGRIGSIAWSSGQNRIVRQRTTGIRESPDHRAESRPERRTRWKLRRPPFGANVRRAAARHRHHIVWIGTVAAAQGERCHDEKGGSRNPVQGCAAGV